MNYNYSAEQAGATAGMSAGTMIFYLIVCAVAIVALWKVFTKANEAGWASIIPLYNTYVLFKITWGNGWYFLLMLIPCVNIVIEIMTMVKLAKVFGKSTGFAIGLILLNPIFMLILAFDDSQYIGVQQ